MLFHSMTNNCKRVEKKMYNTLLNICIFYFIFFTNLSMRQYRIQLLYWGSAFWKAIFFHSKERSLIFTKGKNSKRYWIRSPFLHSSPWRTEDQRAHIQRNLIVAGGACAAGDKKDRWMIECACRKANSLYRPSSIIKCDFLRFQ